MDQDLALLPFDPGEPPLVVQDQDVITVGGLEELVMPLVLNLHRHSASFSFSPISHRGRYFPVRLTSILRGEP
jgi:hypothetical protein